MPCWTKVCDNCVCDIENREDLGTSPFGMSLEQCEQKCNDSPGCNAVEYSAGTSLCVKCTDPSQHHSWEDKSDKGYPQSVHQRGIL